jgi:hypothetical protein
VHLILFNTVPARLSVTSGTGRGPWPWRSSHFPDACDISENGIACSAFENLLVMIRVNGAAELCSAWAGEAPVPTREKKSGAAEGEERHFRGTVQADRHTNGAESHVSVESQGSNAVEAARIFSRILGQPGSADPGNPDLAAV